MAQIVLGPSRAYPNVPTIGDSVESHTAALNAIVEALNIHERRIGNSVLDSFVRVSELETLGLVKIDGKIVSDNPTEESTTHHHDGTYLRLDGTNDPVTGSVSFSGGLSATGATIGGAIDLSGKTSFTGLAGSELDDATNIAFLDGTEDITGTWSHRAGAAEFYYAPNDTDYFSFSHNGTAALFYSNTYGYSFGVGIDTVLSFDGSGIYAGKQLNANAGLAVTGNITVTGTVDGVDVAAHAANSDIHIAHSGVTLTAGAGLTGGGTIAASRTFNVGAGTGITVNADNVALSAGSIASLALADTALQNVVEDTTPQLGGHLDATSKNIDAVGNLDFGSSLGDKVYWYGSTYYTGIEGSTLYHRSATYVRWYIGVTPDGGVSDTMQLDSTGLTVNGNIVVTGTVDGRDVAADGTAQDSHIANSDIHIAHSGVTLTAGAGLTGGGTIAASRTFNVGAGTGITVNADNVALSAGSIASLALADTALQNVVEDLTPQLGGNLDSNGFDIDIGSTSAIRFSDGTDSYYLHMSGGWVTREASTGGALGWDLSDTTTWLGLTRVMDDLQQDEQASPNGAIAGRGTWWVRNTAPNLPYFTDDTGLDRFLNPEVAEFQYKYDTETLNGVGTAAGEVRFNSSTPSVVATMWIHETDYAGRSQVGILNNLQVGDTVVVKQANSDTMYFRAILTSVGDSGTYMSLGLNVLAYGTTMPSQDEPVHISFFPTASGSLPTGSTDNAVLTWDNVGAAWIENPVLRVNEVSGEVRFYQPGTLDYVEFTHDGNDLLVTSANTATMAFVDLHVELRDVINLQFGSAGDIRMTWDSVDLEMWSLLGNWAWQIRDGVKLTLWDSTDTDSAELHHDGVDFNITLTNTTDFNITGAPNVKIFGGGAITIYDSTGADYVSLNHSGTIVTMSTVGAASMDFTGGAGTEWNFRDGGELRVYDTNDTNYLAGLHNGTNAILKANSGSVILQESAADVFQTQVYNATGASTGAQVKAHGGTFYDVGLHVVPVYEIDANDTFDVDHAGMMWHKDLNAAVTFTCENTSDAPNGSMWFVHNDDTEDLTIGGHGVGGVSVYWLEGGAAPTAGNVAVKQGGIVTVYKYTNTEYWVWGSKEAGAGGGASQLNDLSDVVITAAANKEYLRHNGTNWVDAALDISDDATPTLGGPLANAGNAITGSGAVTVTGEVAGAYLGVENTTQTNGYGLSLYNGGVAGQPTYGMMFSGTSTFGIHGAITTANWATYLTMNNTAGRGWIFRDVSTPANVASISNTGIMYINGQFYPHGQTVGKIEAVTGNYGSIQVSGADGSSGGYSGVNISGDSVFMSNATTAGLYDDIDNVWKLNWSVGANAGVVLYYNTVTELQTVSNTATSAASGVQVKDHGGTFRYAGFNTLDTFNMNVSDTLEAQHCGKITGKTNTTAYTLTGPDSTATADVDDFPVGGVCTVVNLGTSVNYTINDTASCTMYYLDGSAAPVDIVGSGTLAPGGIVTLWRYSTTAIYIWGSGFTP